MVGEATSSSFIEVGQISYVQHHNMILGQISWTDCSVFVFFLIPQLLLTVDLSELIITLIKAVPFLGKSNLGLETRSH